MSQVTESRASSTVQPNIQDAFLNNARRDRVPVTIHLMDGRGLRGPHQELRQVRRHLRRRRQGSHGVQARHCDYRDISHLTPFPRVVLIVLDSVGCGELPDAGAYGDQGSNTLGNIARRDLASNSESSRRSGSAASSNLATAAHTDHHKAYGRMAESSAGKDSVTGHWEMMGIILNEPFATFPDGFPAETIEVFERSDRMPDTRECGGFRHGDHRSARRRTCQDRLADRLHVSRQRVSDRCARGSHPGRRALSNVRDCVRARRARLRVGRVIARPFVGTAGVVSSHGPTVTITR